MIVDLAGKPRGGVDGLAVRGEREIGKRLPARAPYPELRFHGRAPAARLLDAGHALGPVAGRVATEEAARLAGEHGTGTVVVARSNYFGATAQYTLELARRDLLGVCCTNSDALVAPKGGARRLFGTNPLSFAVRGEGDDLFCVDMATSQSSFTQVKQLWKRGEALEPGWAVAPDGRDASELKPGEVPVEELALLPLGGPLGAHKGQCLAMMVEILCCLLAGMPYDHELSHYYGTPLDELRPTSHFFLALDVAAFQPLEHFRRRLSGLMAGVRAESREGVEVLAPGDLETATSRARRERGVPVPAETLAELRRVDREAEPAERVGL